MSSTYAYWKSPIYLGSRGMPESLSSVELKDMVLGHDYLGAFLRHSIGDDFVVEGALVDAYLARYTEQVQAWPRSVGAGLRSGGLRNWMGQVG